MPSENEILENVKPENIPALYNLLDKIDEPRDVCIKLLKYHKGDIEVSKFLYYVIITYDINFPDFYEIAMNNISLTNLPNNLTFIEEILNSDISLVIIQKYIDHLSTFLLDLRTTDLIELLVILGNVYTKNKALKRDHPQFKILERGVPSVRAALKMINMR